MTDDDTGWSRPLQASGWLRSDDLTGALEQLQREPGVLVSVVEVGGSAPRGQDAWMLVFADRVWGTVGGGHLEWEAVAWARSGQGFSQSRRFALGPALGQCCGGVMVLRCEAVSGEAVASLAARLAPRLQPVAVFGGGHVGQALIRALMPLPFDVTWVDSREAVFPHNLPPQIHVEASEPVESAVKHLVPQSQVVIMSFSHAEDFEVVQACLERQRAAADLPFVGLIGSPTKWATFQKRLRQRGLDDELIQHITCPIGIPGITGKQPAVIAASVVAQLLKELPRTDARG